MSQESALAHVEDECAKLVSEWKSKGFNGIRFVECYMQPSRWEDFEADERTREEFDDWRSRYACFVAHPDLYNDFGRRGGNPYAKSEIDWFGCYEDLKREIRKRCGDDVQINHRSGCKEFEVERPV